MKLKTRRTEKWKKFNKCSDLFKREILSKVCAQKFYQKRFVISCVRSSYFSWSFPCECICVLVALTSLKYLSVAGCRNIDDWCLDRFVDFRDSLLVLDVSRCPQVTERGLATLHKLQWVWSVPAGFILTDCYSVYDCGRLQFLPNSDPAINFWFTETDNVDEPNEVTTCQEILQMSGNLTAIRKCQYTWPKVGKYVSKSAVLYPAPESMKTPDATRRLAVVTVPSVCHHSDV